MSIQNNETLFGTLVLILSALIIAMTVVDAVYNGNSIRISKDSNLYAAHELCSREKRIDIVETACGVLEIGGEIK